jgi:hypothetical protein
VFGVKWREFDDNRVEALGRSAFCVGVCGGRLGDCGV